VFCALALTVTALAGLTSSDSAYVSPAQAEHAAERGASVRFHYGALFGAPPPIAVKGPGAAPWPSSGQVAPVAQRSTPRTAKSAGWPSVPSIS